MSVEHVALRAPAPRATKVPCPREFVVLLLEDIFKGREYTDTNELLCSTFNFKHPLHRISTNYSYYTIVIYYLRWS